MDPIPLRGPRIRRAPIPPSARLLLRGHNTDTDIDARQAEEFLRRYPDWGHFGLSAYYFVTEQDLDDLAAERLHPFSLIALFQIADLTDHGFEVLPTFRTPHVTVAFTGALEERLVELELLRIELRENPYHEPTRPIRRLRVISDET